MYLINLFSNLAWYNIGYIDWEPWLAQIFTRILNRFSLPVGKKPASRDDCLYMMPDVAQWLVAMIGNGGSCLQYLRDLFTATKTFYHPSNTGEFQQYLIEFILKLVEPFVERVRLERKIRPHWTFVPHESHRLTEQDITDFVNCIKDYAFMSIFNEDYIEDAAKACQYLSILRPELIVPPIMKKLFLSIDNITEPGRFTLIMKCLPGIICQIVRQTSNYSEGQTYVLTLMMSILPCIDSNDFEKIAVTLEVLDAILKLVPCIDCSSAIHTRNDLTEIEKRVCLSTTQFEDFITDFLNRIFQMISIRSAEMFDDAVANDVFNEDDKFIQIIHQKIIKFLTGSLFSSKVRKFVAGLVRVIIKVNPIEILKYLLPQTCEHIENIMNNSQTAILMDHKGDIELTWHLVLFSELVRARGDTLLIYKQMIMSVFHQCIRIVHKDSYEAIAKAAKHLLKSLSDLYSIDDQLSLENMDESFVDCLPIRAWGQHVDFDQLQVQYHFPTVDEIDFACEFVNTFIYAELQLLNEKCLNLSKEERLRSLTLIHYIAVGCLRM
ncbi:unnamed protein product, partial [Rotaria sordida]